MTDQGSRGAPSSAQGPAELAHEGKGHARGLTDREFRAAVEASDIGLWVYDVVEDSVVWSASMCRIAGVTDDDRPRSYADWRELVHPEDLARVEAMVQESLLRGEYPDLEHRLLRKDGEVRNILSKGSVERGPDGGPRRLAGMVIDVTEQRRLEAQIREDMRLESLGRLAGGIAHDFNNMLTVILGSANLALDLSGATGMVADNLAAIRDAAERSATLTAQLLAFARRHSSLPRPADLGELVTRGLGLVRHLVGPSIRITADLAPSVPVEVDPNQFQQVLMNLAANARDALPNGGPSRSAHGSSRGGGGRWPSSRSRTMGRASHPRCCRVSSSRSFRPRGRSAARGWGSRRSMASSANTAAMCTCTASWGAAPGW